MNLREKFTCSIVYAYAKRNLFRTCLMNSSGFRRYARAAFAVSAGAMRVEHGIGGIPGRFAIVLVRRK